MTHKCPQCHKETAHATEITRTAIIHICTECGRTIFKAYDAYMGEEVTVVKKDSKNAKDVIEALLSAMDMQEKRETEEFHIPQPSALKIWSEAKEQAQQYLDTWWKNDL